MPSFLLLILFLVVSSPKAQTYCQLVGHYLFAQDLGGTYLGLISTSTYASESIINPYGNYGSEYSSSSIRNEYSNFGSPYGTYSAYNEYSSKPPMVLRYSTIDSKYYLVGYCSKNNYAGSPVYDPDLLIALLEEGCSGPKIVPKIVSTKIKKKPSDKFNVFGGTSSSSVMFGLGYKSVMFSNPPRF